MTKFSKIKPLAIFSTPLSGINLIEASAGTGKTWTITSLYLRLLLESGMEVEHILVVTYTKAATAELKERIRSRLAEMLATLQGQGKDKFCEQLSLNITDKPFAIRALIRAIHGFDQAAIYTIHGFCQRMLTDYTFESNVDYDQELVVDEKELLTNIVDDFWRREWANAEPLVTSYFYSKGITPDDLTAELSALVARPYLNVVGGGQSDMSHLPQVIKIYEDAFQQAYDHWIAEQTDILAALDLSVLKGNIYNATKISVWVIQLEAFFQRPDPLYPPDCLKYFTSEKLSASTKKNLVVPSHRFFAECQTLKGVLEKLQQALEQCLVNFKRRLLNECNQQLPQLKQAQKKTSFQDLLNQLAEALTGSQGDILANLIRRQYKAALIDEFQDTDPTQYIIFKQLFFNRHKEPVFLVGDPKQAIYGFRGADIFSYLAAKQNITECFTLDTNQRSVPSLIDAVNALFNVPKNANPFLFEDINYPPVKPADKSHNELTITNESSEALRFWLLPEHEKPYSRAQGELLAANATANKIAQLFNQAEQGCAHIAGQQLGGGDIAILVASHNQGHLMQQALLARQVPSVRYGQDNVFATEEAAALLRVLAAVAEPSRETLLKAALTTHLMGQTAHQIEVYQHNENEWVVMLEQFSKLHSIAVTKSFIVMFQHWLEAFQVVDHLLQFEQGERCLINLLHLSELLQQQNQNKLGFETLVEWFQTQLNNPPSGQENALLRLESDADRVKIVTIHSSKGLEYPIVFCPFLWHGRLISPAAKNIVFHAEKDRLTCLDFNVDKSSSNYDQAELEARAENLRLLYVALTRAKYRCYVVWGAVKNIEKSALAYLLGQHQGHSNATTDDYCRAHLSELVEQHSTAMNFEQWPEETDYQEPDKKVGEELRPLTLSPALLKPKWRMSSYTGLVSGRHSEKPVYDEQGSSEVDEADELNQFNFPRGPIAGVCLHSIFEQWDFTCQDRNALQKLVQNQLQAYQLGVQWTDVACEMVSTTLQVALNEQRFKLADLADEHRLVELGFVFPVQHFAIPKLIALLEREGFESSLIVTMKLLRKDQVTGYLKGFIDLIGCWQGRFYIIDYKSNWLGAHAADYEQFNLNAEISHHHYALQYLIYLVALHRYLKIRLPDYQYAKHIGGVYYLFLRGMSLDQATGIFFDLPSADLIAALDRLFEGNEL
ncbi:MAG: exodeoxyribonuclease V subunit beta [Methylococcaceae bacterium]